MQTMGSMARVIPGFKVTACAPLGDEIRHLGFFVQTPTDAVTNKSLYYRVAVAFNIFLHRQGDVIQIAFCPGLLNPLIKRLFRNLEKIIHLVGNFPDRNCDGGIAKKNLPKQLPYRN